MPRVKGHRKKRRTHVVEDDHAEHADGGQVMPRSFVFRQGKVAKPIQQLVFDLRKIMEPYTASKLQESRKNKLKDFMQISGSLGITHMISLQHHELGPTMRVIKSPKGPTLTFRLLQYSLMKDVAAMQRKPHAPGASGEYASSPLVVLNGFSGNETFKQITGTALQHMFPSIDVNNVVLKDCRRVVLFNMHEIPRKSEDSNQVLPPEVIVDMRHYLINAAPVGLHKTVKKVIKGKIPNLSKFRDMEEYVLRGQDVLSSDSEAEDTPDTRVVLPQDFAGKGNMKSESSAVRLKEIGPRLTLKLLKIEEGVSSGLVLYHHSIVKSESEIKELERQKKERTKMKEQRKAIQMQNVELKKQNKKRKREGKSTGGDDDEESDGNYSSEEEGTAEGYGSAGDEEVFFDDGVEASDGEE